MRWLKALAILLLAMACVALGSVLGGSSRIKWDGAYEIAPADFITIILTAVSVLLTLLTIFLAVFGFIGWATINDKLREHSQKYFEDELRDGRPLADLIGRAVRVAVYEGVVPIPDRDDPYPIEPSAEEIK